MKVIFQSSGSSSQTHFALLARQVKGQFLDKNKVTSDLYQFLMKLSIILKIKIYVSKNLRFLFARHYYILKMKL